jgi:hypothetical protein
VPFVQGQLRKDEKLTFYVETECAHCHKPLHIDVDDALNYRVVQRDSSPLVFVPMVNFGTLDDPSIIDAF